MENKSSEVQNKTSFADLKHLNHSFRQEITEKYPFDYLVVLRLPSSRSSASIVIA